MGIVAAGVGEGLNKITSRTNKQGQTLKETSIRGCVWLIAEGEDRGAAGRGGPSTIYFFKFLNAFSMKSSCRSTGCRRRYCRVQSWVNMPPVQRVCGVGGYQRGQMGLTVKITTDIPVDLCLIIKQISH